MCEKHKVHEVDISINLEELAMILQGLEMVIAISDVKSGSGEGQYNDFLKYDKQHAKSAKDKIVHEYLNNKELAKFIKPDRSDLVTKDKDNDKELTKSKQDENITKKNN